MDEKVDMHNERSHFRLLVIRVCTLPFFLAWQVLQVLAVIFNSLKHGFGSRLLDAFVSRFENRTETIRHRTTNNIDLVLHFFTPNFVCKWRASTFSTKEPETLKWIDEYGGDGVFFDVGANIGLYSIYYAKSKKGKVFAFEPSVLNTKQLAKNISLNQASDVISILSSPLTDQNGFAQFKHASLEEGSALSSFGVPYGQDGKSFHENLSYSLLGFSLDFLVEVGLIPGNPSLIKIDVDGIEHLILRGAIKTLKNPECKSVLVEVTPKFVQQTSGVHQYLSEAGYTLQNPDDGKNPNGYNQIWVRE